MLPDIQQSDYLYQVPQFQLDRDDIVNMSYELKGFHENFAECFQRSDSNDDLGHPDGAIIFDGSGFVKKGNDSIGVGHQYCGTIGKVDNSQVGIFATYASRHG